MNNQKTRRPILRWAGSKTQILGVLSGFWSSEYDRYIEPFCGSAALFTSLKPEKAILADTNCELIESYLAIRDAPSEVYAAIKEWAANEEEYYKVRGLDVSSLDRQHRAARFVYLNRYCFNGLYRTNLSGVFNVPWGASKAAAMPELEDFKTFGELLSRATLLPHDFARTLRRARPGDFVYLDPPYRVSTRRVFREYNALGFRSSDLVRLRRSLLSLNRRGVAFLLSYIDSPEAEFLGRGFLQRRVEVKRFIAGATEKRSQAREVLVSNRHSTMQFHN